MIRRDLPLLVVTFYGARSKEGLGGRVSTSGPETPFKPVGRPSPTGTGLFSDVKSEHLSRDARTSYAPTTVLARGNQPRNDLVFDTAIKSSDVRYGRRPCREQYVGGYPTFTSIFIRSGPAHLTAVTIKDLV